jgi:hypothetical protein
MKHTPGPWIVVEGEDDNGNACFIVDCQDGLNFDFAIATLHGSDDQANAKLIAAAPDLLEALADLCYCVGAAYGESHVYKEARAAIAKATGEKEVEV